MVTKYTGKSGKIYTIIEPAIGKGGEGSIYKIVNMPNYVLKIFSNENRTETRNRKLLAMISTPLSDDAMQQVTWPIDVVYDNGQFMGYVMPSISNNEHLNVMYSDKYTFTFSDKITIARNLCVAINAVHNAGQVCGDLNPQNIGVDPKSARVTLVDTDSYHITEKGSGRIYRCEMGLPEYLPREIQMKMKNGVTLKNAPLPTFTRQTDLFALAVHIFALLMNGCHPFACAVNNSVNINRLTKSQPSVATPQPIDNICTGFFPFYEKKTKITTPKYAPQFDILPKYMRSLFVRAFVDGHNNPQMRPDTVEWYNALIDMERNISKCKIDKMHLYSSHLKKCPWCELENRLKQPILISNVSLPSIAQQKAINISSYKTSKRTSNLSNTYKTRNSSVWASKKMLWIMTYMISLGIQATVHILFGNTIVGEIFGYEYGSGIESWGSNLAIWLGPWGFVICSAIGTWLYNTYWCMNGNLYGYKWYHYLLSVIVSLLASAAWILVVLAISLAIMLIVGALIIAFVCGVLSGS